LQAGGRRFDPGHIHQRFQRIAVDAHQFTLSNVVESVETRRLFSANFKSSAAL